MLRSGKGRVTGNNPDELSQTRDMSTSEFSELELSNDRDSETASEVLEVWTEDNSESVEDRVVNNLNDEITQIMNVLRLLNRKFDDYNFLMKENNAKISISINNNSYKFKAINSNQEKINSGLASLRLELNDKLTNISDEISQLKLSFTNELSYLKD